MANVDARQIKKYKLGELAGNIALVFCGVVLAWFIIGFSIARTQEIKPLELATLISSPILMCLGVAAAAYCNLKYGAALTKAIRKFVVDTFVENAQLMHPERPSLTFNITVDGNAADLQVNGYKEKIKFDFSAFGKLTLSRRVGALNEIENKLTSTFCRLFERGAKYSDVSYTERATSRRKSGKPVYIIKDGQPDKAAYKIYLKNKASQTI